MSSHQVGAGSPDWRPGPSTARFRFSAALYWLLLLAHPRAFRRRFGAAMVAAFVDSCADLAGSGAFRGRFDAWRIALKDLFLAAPREHSRARRRRRSPATSAEPGVASSPAPGSGRGDGHGRGRLDILLQDIRFGARTLRRQPGFTVVAILTLGLGIGATTAIFSVIDAVILQPLPYPEADRLIRWWETTPNGSDFSTSQPNFLDYRAMNTTFGDMAAATYMSLSLVGDGEPLQLDASVVTPSMFTLLGAKPVVGRTFTPEEGTFGADTRLVLLSHALWQERFGADSGIGGQTVTLDGTPYVVVGVMPAEFDFPFGPDVWIPLAPNPGEVRGDHRLFGIGRLRDGVTLEQARKDMDALAARLSDEYPESNAGWGVRLATFPNWLVPPELKRGMLVLLAAVGLLLLIACANVSNLLIARATSRQREIGLRASLGAGRNRIIQQLLTESVLLGIGGSILGLLLAYWSVPVVRAMTPEGIPRLDDASVNASALLFTLALSAITGLVFGLAPAIQASGPNLLDAVNGGDRVVNAGGRRLRNVMVVSELALAVMLLIGAGLLISSFSRLRQTDTGFQLDNVLTVPVSLSAAHYTETGEERMQFFTEVMEGIEALPGVVAVGATNVAPLGGGATATEFSIEGRPATSVDEMPMFAWRAVTPGFFEATGVSLLKGRGFSMEEDWHQTTPIVVVSEKLAGETWPGEDPVGKRVAFGMNTDAESWLTVAGVVADVRDERVDVEPDPVVYFSYRFAAPSWGFMNLTIKSSVDPTTLAAAIRREIWEVDPTLPIPEVMPLAQNFSMSVAQPRFHMMLMGLFAGVALLLAAVGVYGIMAFAVTQRTREIGIRMALGAGSTQVMRMVLRQAMTLAGIGIVIGVLVAAASSRFVESLLYETQPVNVLTYGAVAFVLAAVAAVSALLPALRATRVDPKLAMTSE